MDIIINNCSKKYNNTNAIKNLNLTISKGVCSIIGANGAGKTTLLNMISGIITPTSGDILFGGNNIRSLDEDYRANLGYLPQQFGYHKSFKVNEYLEYIAVLKGLNKERYKNKIDYLLKILSLSEVKNKYIKQLSGGTQRRVGIAQALLNDPYILILDEPTSGLDPNERIVLRKLLSELGKEKIILVSTHIISDIENISNDNVFLSGGEVLYSGTKDYLIEKINKKVWIAKLSSEYIEQYIDELNIVNIQNDGSDYTTIRYICDTEKITGSINVQPTLEDFYTWAFNIQSELR